MFAAAASLSLLALPVLVSAVQHNITVGGTGILAYDPPFVNAAVGDTLHFIFKQKNHTVTQSSFAKPCSPLTDASGAQVGFKSGFQPVPDTMTDGFPTCDWAVKTTDPLWVYCGQTNPVSHCGKGMVFAVNPPTTGNTFDAFKANALAQDGGAGSAPAPGGYGSAAPPAPSGTDAAPTTVTATIAAATATWTTTYASVPGSPDATPNAVPSVITVTVGGTGVLAFNPPRVDAKIGDIINFVFKAKNHTVTQSSFAQPCQKIPTPIAGTTSVLDSGFQPSTDAGPFPQYNVTVQTTSPLWFYCAQGAHCSAGMVFAVNSVESSANNYAAFVAKAKGSGAASGNSTSTNSTSTPGSTGSNGAASRMILNVGTSLSVVAAALALLL